MKTVWILTSEVNDYDQYGEYFEAVFKEKPTLEQLMSKGVPKDYAQSCLESGGERLYPTEGADTWWNLREYPI